MGSLPWCALHSPASPQLGGDEVPALTASNNVLRDLARGLSQAIKAGLVPSELLDPLVAELRSHTERTSRLLAANVERWSLVS